MASRPPRPARRFPAHHLRHYAPSHPAAVSLAIVNFVLAAARVPLWNYTLGTALGIAPRTAAAAFVAAGLEQLHAKDLTDTPLWMLLSGMIAFVLMCIVLGALANRALRTMAAPGK